MSDAGTRPSIRCRECPPAPVAGRSIAIGAVTVGGVVVDRRHVRAVGALGLGEPVEFRTGRPRRPAGLSPDGPIGLDDATLADGTAVGGGRRRGHVWMRGSLAGAIAIVVGLIVGLVGAAMWSAPDSVLEGSGWGIVTALGASAMVFGRTAVVVRTRRACRVRGVRAVARCVTRCQMSAPTRRPVVAVPDGRS